MGLPETRLRDGSVTMATYQYRCRTCGELFEVQQSLEEHAKAALQCPKCKGTDVEQVFGAFYVKTAKRG